MFPFDISSLGCDGRVSYRRMMCKDLHTRGNSLHISLGIGKGWPPATPRAIREMGLPAREDGAEVASDAAYAINSDFQFAHLLIPAAATGCGNAKSATILNAAVPRTSLSNKGRTARTLSKSRQISAM